VPAVLAPTDGTHPVVESRMGAVAWGLRPTPRESFACEEFNFVLNGSPYRPALAKRLRHFDCAKNHTCPRSIVQEESNAGRLDLDRDVNDYIDVPYRGDNIDLL